VNPVNWTAVLGLGLCLLAVAIILAISVGVYLARQWMVQQQSHHLKKTRILRAQFLSQLRLIEKHLTPRSKPLNNFGSELFEPLQAMWMQADILEPEEMEAVHRTCRILFILRKKPSLNKKDVNVATDAIQQTFRVFEASASNAVPPSRPGTLNWRSFGMFRGKDINV
jgi:hypothetical protein